MSIEIEIICDGHTTKCKSNNYERSPDDLEDIADNNHQSVLETLQGLYKDALSQGWQCIDGKWYCPECLDAMKSEVPKLGG